MFRYSATQWIYGEEDIEDSLKRLKKYDYDGIELAGEPYTLKVVKVQELLAQYDMTCTSICGIYTDERDLSSSDPMIRAKAVQYVKDCVDMAVALGAAHVIVVPSPVGKMEPDATSTEQESWETAVRSVREAGQYASTKKVNLAIEAINRYETYLVNNMDKAMAFMQEVNVENVMLMADLFHMNIEERNIGAMLERIAPHLVHVHIADNTREAAGVGHTDFAQVIRILIKANYRGPLTMEFLPSIANPYDVSQHQERTEMYDKYTEQSIRHIKNLVAEHSFTD